MIGIEFLEETLKVSSIMKANSKTLLFWKFYNLIIVLQAQEVQRSFWNLPKIFQNGTTDILSEHEYCIIILKNEARLDHNYINACEKWMKYHFYANFDPKIIEKNKLVERSFWLIPKYFQKYTDIESEEEYCQIRFLSSKTMLKPVRNG